MGIKKQLFVGILLGIAGFAANWFKLPLFFTIDFVLGSFFVMIALLCSGFVAGVTAGVIAGSCTMLLWQHPFALVIFSAEAVVVGLLNGWKKKGDILFYDIAFWLCFGAPLSWFFYNYILGDSPSWTYLIILKQAMNGIFNTLLAAIFYLFWVARKKDASDFPTLRQAAFTAMISVVLFTAFYHVVTELRENKTEMENKLAGETIEVSKDSRSLITLWLKDRIQVVQALANMVGDPDRRSTREMQQLVETVKETSPSIGRLGVMARNATTVAYSPLQDELGISTLGISLADHPYIKTILEEKRPYIAGIVVGEMGRKVPIIPLIVPMVPEGEYKGFCAGLVKTEELKGFLGAIVNSRPLTITILDQSGQVVVSTREELSIMDRYARPAAGDLTTVSAELVHWVPPPEKGKNLMQRWSKSLFISEMEISPESRWKIVVENSYNPILTDLRQTAITYIFQLLMLTFAIIPFSYLVCFRLTRSLELLQEATRSLPETINNRSLSPLLPVSHIREVKALTDNFILSREILQSQHDRLIELNVRLEEKSASLVRSEERYRQLIENSPDCIALHDRDLRHLYVSPALTKLVGQPQEAFTGKTVWEMGMPPESASALDSLLRSALETGQNVPGELIFTAREGSRYYNWRSIPLKDHDGTVTEVMAIAVDITNQKHIEDERANITDFLRLVNECRSTEELVKRGIDFFWEKSGCEAIGIRIKDGDDFPYYETRGFSPSFVEMESRLCVSDEKGKVVRNSSGNPVIMCMCGNVLTGRIDPELPFFTPFGSFWTISTTGLIAAVSPVRRQSGNCNMCNKEGYESVALVPLKAGIDNLGLLQMNDSRAGKFTLETIAYWERLAGYFGSALAKFQALKELGIIAERFRSMFERHKAVMLVIEPESGVIVDANLAASEFYGYPINELRAMTIQEINQLSPEEVAAERNLAAEEKRSYFIFPHRLGNGDLHWVEVYSTPFESRGEPLLFSVIHDISDRRLAEMEKQKFISLADHSAEFIGMCDMNLVPFYMNEAGLRLVGLDSPEESFRTNITDFFFPEDREFIKDDFFPRVFNDGNGEVEIRFRHSKTGEPIWMICNAFHVKDIDGKPVGLAMVSRNISERKKAEYEVVSRVGELKIINDELERFNMAAVDRELRMIELKKEINKLRVLAGLEPRYPLEFED